MRSMLASLKCLAKEYVVIIVSIFMPCFMCGDKPIPRELAGRHSNSIGSDHQPLVAL